MLHELILLSSLLSNLLSKSHFALHLLSKSQVFGPIFARFEFPVISMVSTTLETGTTVNPRGLEIRLSSSNFH